MLFDWRAFVAPVSIATYAANHRSLTKFDTVFRLSKLEEFGIHRRNGDQDIYLTWHADIIIFGCNRHFATYLGVLELADGKKLPMRLGMRFRPSISTADKC